MMMAPSAPFSFLDEIRLNNIFQKSIDNSSFMCYTLITVKKGE